jgi:hypothetical protein
MYDLQVKILKTMQCAYRCLYVSFHMFVMHENVSCHLRLSGILLFYFRNADHVALVV